MPFEWPLCAFLALRATLSFFDGLIYMCKYQSWFRVNQRWISAVQRWKSNVSEQRKSALNSADSELFLSETALFSSETALIFSVLNSADSEKIRADQLWNRADQRWCLSCSLNQRWKTSKLWNSAVQRWLHLGLQPGILWTFNFHSEKQANFWPSPLLFSVRMVWENHWNFNKTLWKDRFEDFVKFLWRYSFLLCVLLK